MVLLDTHIWLWWLLGHGNLTNPEKNSLDRLASRQQVVISWVTIWETEMLERKGRIVLKPDFKSWIRTAVQPDITTVLTVDLDVVLTQRHLPESFHSDPADRLIVSTSLLSGYPLATHDKRIVDAGCCEIWKRNGKD